MTGMTLQDSKTFAQGSKTHNNGLNTRLLQKIVTTIYITRWNMPWLHKNKPLSQTFHLSTWESLELHSSLVNGKQDFLMNYKQNIFALTHLIVIYS